MSAPKDGGPAFACAKEQLHQVGMSLRDYFAAKAMQGEMITSFSDATPEAAQAFADEAKAEGHTPLEHLAFNSYLIADAMLAEREKVRA